jgi:3-phenylpropionate/cinnamic acid dioxygenase small subunit
MTTSKEVPVEIDLAVRRVLARYCLLVDDRDFDQLLELFTEDARFNVLGNDLHGRAAIREWMNGIPPSMFHHVTNVVVSNGSHGTTHAISDCTVGARQDDGAWSIRTLGRYHDTFVGDGRNVQFSQRIFTPR